MYIHGNNNFVEEVKNLARYRSKNISVTDHQKNYVEA